MKPLLLALITLFSLAVSQAQSTWLSPSKDELTLGSAHVERTQDLTDPTMSVKLFHVMPIDPPSFNPWFLRLAVVNEDNNTWNVYALGNVSAYKVLPSAQHGYLKIALSKDDYDVESGKHLTRKSTLFINLHTANRSGGKIEIEEK